jgi:Fe-S-cluster-containing dehydrogenase component
MAKKDNRSKMVNVPNATMMIVHDPTRCVGCRRCEIACTEYNEGKTQPALSRIKIARNYNFGPRGVQAGFWNTEGFWAPWELGLTRQSMRIYFSGLTD